MDNMKKFLISGYSRVLIYEGMTGYGKSQILKEVEYLAQGERHRCVTGRDAPVQAQRSPPAPPPPRPPPLPPLQLAWGMHSLAGARPPVEQLLTPETLIHAGGACVF